MEKEKPVVLDMIPQTPQSLIYFVDDDVAVCKAMERTIQPLGYHVVSFFSARDCLKELKQNPCDVLITDVRMQDMDGLELLVEVKRLMPWVPVLVVTGYGDVPLAVEAIKLGAANFIEKPLERGAFMTALVRLLEKGTRASSELGKSLTKTEQRILYFVLQGMNSREIATQLHRSLRTVELHRHHVMQKLGVDNVVSLVRRTMDMGLFPLQESLGVEC